MKCYSLLLCCKKKMTIKLGRPVTDHFFFGREEESVYLTKLLAGFERSDTTFVLVEGPPGIGKTSLVRHVLQNHRTAKTFLLYGKCSNQPGQVPYHAWKEAIGDWMNQILVLSEDELNALRENALASLQSNTGTVTAVFEELVQFFGKKWSGALPVKTEPHQIKSKFYYFFARFLKSVGRSGYRIILFLDDLQWADPASRALIGEIVLRNAVPGLTIVGAQRPPESGAGQFSEVAQLEKEYPTRVFRYQLKSLGSSHFSQFLPAQWNFTPDETAALGQYLWSGSGGNPLKAKELIKSIENDNPAVDSSTLSTIWEDFVESGRSGSAEHLVRNQLTALPRQQRMLLSAASCIGYYFGAELLKRLFGHCPDETDQLLSRLEHEELLIRQDDTYIFVHDVIFSAANSLMAAEEKAGFHQKIGRLILDDLQNYEQDEFFKAVNHLNAGWESLENARDFNGELILLNIHAARRAIKKSAFEKAQQYFSFADSLLVHLSVEKTVPGDRKLVAAWGGDVTGKNNLQYLILFGFAETSFLMQQFDQALFYANQVLNLKISRHQKILATLIKIRVCSALIYKSDVQEVLQDGMQSLESVLNDFGVVFPADPDELMREADLNACEISRLAANLSEGSDFASKVNTDGEYQDLMKLVMNAMTFVYYMDVRKNLYMGIKFLHLNFTKGFTPMTPVLFSVSFISASVSPVYTPMAFLLGKISLKMIESLPFSNYSYIVYYIATLNFFVWEKPYKTGIRKLKQSVLQAKEAGDHHYASFCATNILLLNTYRGHNLEKHRLYAAKLARQNQHVFFIGACDAELSAYLAGTKAGFLESRFVFPESLVRDAEKNLSGRFHLNLARQKLYYLSGNIEKALEAGYECERLESIYRGFQIKLEHYFFYSLILLQQVRENSRLLSEALEEINPKLEEFRRLQSYGSGNYRHKVLLLEAEIARCHEEFETATRLYDQAISEAKRQKFNHHAAIASELAGNCYFGKNPKRFGRIYLKEAFQLYRKWGADAKLEWLKQKYPFLQKEVQRGLPTVASAYRPVNDLIRQAALLRELELAETGKILLAYLTEQSHAGAGVILVQRSNVWKVLVANTAGGAGMENKPLDTLENRLPLKVLNYAINKGERLLISDAGKIPLFDGDPYLNEFSTISVFCYPVLFGMKTEALIYLGNVDPGLEKDEWFSLLAEHVVTALANALQDENLNRLNRELQVQEQKKIEAVIASQEKERKRIAEELHDSVGQMLSLVKLNLSRLETGGELPGSVSSKLVKQTLQQLDASIGELRSISHNLMPPDLETKPLAEIVENLLAKSRSINGPEYQLHVFGIPDDLSEAVKFTLYRILQEILQNIIKHASAGTITVSMTGNDEGINLIVEDDGIGYDPAKARTGLGLKNIHSRVKLLNGYFDVDSAPNRGTIYNITIPINVRDE